MIAERGEVYIPLRPDPEARQQMLTKWAAFSCEERAHVLRRLLEATGAHL